MAEENSGGPGQWVSFDDGDEVKVSNVGALIEFAQACRESGKIKALALGGERYQVTQREKGASKALVFKVVNGLIMITGFRDSTGELSAIEVAQHLNGVLAA